MSVDSSNDADAASHFVIIIIIIIIIINILIYKAPYGHNFRGVDRGT